MTLPCNEHSCVSLLIVPDARICIDSNTASTQQLTLFCKNECTDKQAEDSDPVGAPALGNQQAQPSDRGKPYNSTD